MEMKGLKNAGKFSLTMKYVYGVSQVHVTTVIKEADCLSFSTRPRKNFSSWDIFP